MDIRIVHVTPQAQPKLVKLTRKCYASEARSTPESDLNLLKTVKRNEHHDTLRHAFVVADLEYSWDFLESQSEQAWVLGLLKASPFLRLSDSSAEHGLCDRLSGNFQSFYELWQERLSQGFWPWLDPIFAVLREHCPVFFHDPAVSAYEPIPAYQKPASPRSAYETRYQLSTELVDLYLDEVADVHSYASFWLEADRATTAQLNRHAWEGVLQESQRYVKMSEKPFLWPSALSGLSESQEAVYWPLHFQNATFSASPLTPEERETLQRLERRWKIGDVVAHLETDIRRVYQQLLDLKVRKEDARSVLPMCCHTEEYVTGRLPMIAQCIAHRTDQAAQAHYIRPLAEVWAQMLKEATHVPG